MLQASYGDEAMACTDASKAKERPREKMSNQSGQTQTLPWKCGGTSSDGELGSMEENKRRSEMLEEMHSAKATGSV